MHSAENHSCITTMLISARMNILHAHLYDAYQCVCVHVCACMLLLMSPGDTCDLGKGKVSVLMWQLRRLPPIQMVLIGRGTAQGQLLGVTGGGKRSEGRRKGGKKGEDCLRRRACVQLLGARTRYRFYSFAIPGHICVW